MWMLEVGRGLERAARGGGGLNGSGCELASMDVSNFAAWGRLLSERRNPAATGWRCSRERFL